MTERSLTPNITVTIGHHTRIYFAFVTTAPAELDSPATVTLHSATFADVAGFAAEPDHARRGPRPHIRTTDSRRRDGARLATRTVPRQPASAAARGSRARWPQYAAALVVATPSGAQRQPGCGMNALNSLVGVNRSPRMASFSGGHVMVVKIVPNDKAQPARQTRGCRAAFHRRRARRLEADRVRRLGATQWQWPQRHVPGASVRGQW